MDLSTNSLFTHRSALVSERLSTSDSYQYILNGNQTNPKGNRSAEGNESFSEDSDRDFTKEEFIKEASEYLQFQVGEAIHEYYFPTIISIGIVGNILSFLVMIKPQNRHVTTCLYMASLSVSDTLLIVYQVSCAMGKCGLMGPMGVKMANCHEV